MPAYPCAGYIKTRKNKQGKKMKLLDLSNQFTFKLRDQDGNEREIKGTFRDYTKKETEEAKKRHKEQVNASEKMQKLLRELKRNERSIEIKEKLEDYKAVDRLLNQNAKIEEELILLSEEATKEGAGNGLKERFAICLGGDDKEEIMALADQIGYDVVFKTIQEAIFEGKPKD